MCCVLESGLSECLCMCLFGQSGMLECLCMCLFGQIVGSSTRSDDFLLKWSVFGWFWDGKFGEFPNFSGIFPNFSGFFQVFFRIFSVILVGGLAPKGSRPSLTIID